MGTNTSHLSNEKKHNQAFTSAVVDHSTNDDGTILRFKSDNCSMQYKSKWVFRYWLTVSVEQQKIIIFYYGVTGHGKGLVDAMSDFGMKGHLRRAVLTIENFDYKTADNIYNFLIKLFENDVTKHYYLIHPDTIKSKKIPKNSPLPI